MLSSNLFRILSSSCSRTHKPAVACHLNHPQTQQNKKPPACAQSHPKQTYQNGLKNKNKNHQYNIFLQIFCEKLTIIFWLLSRFFD